MRKSLLAAGVCLFGLAAAALGQGINTVPQPGLIYSLLKQNTYSAVALSLVPASSATDVFCIGGSSTKNIHITYLSVSGTAGTLINVPVTFLLRHSLDTGTVATGTANPANTVGGNNPSNPTATAALVSYTANPTITDTSPAYVRSSVVALNATGTVASTGPIQWYFGATVDFFDQGVDIIKVATPVQQFCVNLNATTITTGSLQIAAEWTEQ